MAKRPKEVTEAELAVLHVLWQRGASTVPEIQHELYPGGGKSEYATVKTLCERLLNKRCVGRDRRHRPHRFRAVIDRDELIGRQLRTVADELCAGSYVPLINHLMRGGALSRAEVDALREQVEDLARKKGRS